MVENGCVLLIFDENSKCFAALFLGKSLQFM